MVLYVARHGQTQWNLEDKVCGSTDLPLTELGLQQARILAEQVGKVRPDVICCGPDRPRKAAVRPAAWR